MIERLLSESKSDISLKLINEILKTKHPI